MTLSSQEAYKRLQAYCRATQTLSEVFPDSRDTLFRAETPTQFEFSTTITEPIWIQDSLPELATDLLDLDFAVSIEARIHDLDVEFEIRKDDSDITFDCTRSEKIDPDPASVIPQDLMLGYRNMLAAFQESAESVPLTDFYRHITNLGNPSTALEISVRIFLSKDRINSDVLNWCQNISSCRIVLFLFSEGLELTLSELSLRSFEKEFFDEDKRTIVIVFNLQGSLSNNQLVICGLQQLETLCTELSTPLSQKDQTVIAETLRFRERQNVWTNSTLCLVPDSLSFPSLFKHENELKRLKGQLASFQGLLAAAFLADYVKVENNSLCVEFRGFGHTRFAIERNTLLNTEQVEHLYQLYLYGYEGLKADKLEIVQQFLSILVADTNSLLGKAKEIQESAQKTYERYLQNNVKDYFAARSKIQERMKQAVEETTKGVIELSRDVSSDLFKTIGLVAVALIGALLKSEVLAALIAALFATMFYIHFVLDFHLKSVQESHNLRQEQHREFIDSFQDVLREEEIKAFRDDSMLKSANAQLDNKIRIAGIIYQRAAYAIVFLLILSGIALAIITLNNKSATKTGIPTLQATPPSPIPTTASPSLSPSATARIVSTHTP